MKKTLRNIVGGFLIGGACLAGAGCGDSVIKEECSTYRGHHFNKGDGLNILVFDDKHKNDRQEAPDLIAVGNPKEFEIGKDYCVKYADGTLGRLPRIYSSEPSN